MALLSPLELEILPALAGAILYAVFLAASKFRSQHRPRPDLNAKLVGDVATAISASLAEGAPAAVSELAEPCPEPCLEQEAAKGSNFPRAAEAPTDKKAPTDAKLEARLAELEAHVARATAPRPGGRRAPAALPFLLGLAVALWAITVLGEQLLEEVEEEQLATSAAPTAEHQAPAARPSAAELEAAGYSVDARGLITLSLTSQHTPIYNVGDVVERRSAHWGTIYVGSPPIPYKVAFDTGSGHLVLPSAWCKSETCRAHRRYRRTASSSAKDINYDGTVVQSRQPRDQVTVSYGTGDVTGVFLEEVVCMDSPAKDSTTVSQGQVARRAADGEDALPPGCMKLRMIAATEMSEQPFKSFDFDGVLGLGLDGLSQTPEFNFITMIAKAMQGAEGVGSQAPGIFAFFLGEGEKENAEITIGGWAQERMVDDELAWRPVHDPEQGHWLVQISALFADGERVRFCDDGECRAVVDTGTSLLAVPPPSFRELFGLLAHPVSEDFDCRGPGPSLSFELGEQFNITMEPQDYAQVQETKSESVELPWHRAAFGAGAAAEVAYCKPMLMSLSMDPPIGPKLFILGEPVLRRYYTVFDAGAKRIGFGRAKHEPLPVGVDGDDGDDDWFFEEE